MANESGNIRVLTFGHEQGGSLIPDMLRGECFELHAAADLEEALRIAQALEPELVFIEDDTGEAKKACERIRSLKLDSRPAVVVISSNSGDKFVADALASGADDCIAKPVSKIRLMARINACQRINRYCGDMLQDKKNIEAVLDMVKAASSTLDADRVLYTIVCKIAEITNAKRCSILLVSDSDTGYVLASNESAEIAELKLDLHKYPEIKEAIRTRNILIIEDMPNHPMMSEIKGFLSGLEGMSVLVAPIIFGETVLGTMLLRAHKRHFREKEVELCRIAANASYPALRNARLYEKLKQEKEGLLKERVESLAKNELKLVAINDALSREMSERKKAEESIRAQAQLIRSIIDNSTAVIYVKDTDGRYLLANKQFFDIFKTDAGRVLGVTDFALFSDEVARNFRENDIKVQEAKAPLEFEETANLDDGPHAYISVKFPLYDSSGDIYAVCGISTDITVRKNLEKEQLKIQKLESIGVLAGGIAHDFNNVLTGILANVSILKECVDKSSENCKRLNDLEKATYRAKELTNQLLTFSKGGKPVKDVIHIGELIKECTDFSARGSSLRCVYDIREPLSPVEADIGQVSQVINNLVINAKQAMPEGGMLKISVENISNAAKMPGGERYVKISVEDHGVGISEENLCKIFDPYFTTKAEGSGLGLSSTYSIIKNHNGIIEVRSKLGEGTVFDIYLPASDKEVTRKLDEAESLVAGSGRVLIMDDDEIIRDVLSSILCMLGYKAVFVINGEEALEQYGLARDAGEPFEAVIMDLTIRGGMGGRETVRKILELDPHAKVIVSSGYHNDPLMSDYLEYGFKGVIPKPYRAAELSRVLKDVIDQKVH